MNIELTRHTCNVCGEERYIPENQTVKECPVCGATMAIV